MIQVYPDVSCLWALQHLIENDVLYQIFVNNVTPDEDTVLGDLSIGSSFNATVTEAAFTIQTIAGHLASVVAAPIAINNGSGGDVDVYGVVAVDALDNTKMLAVCRLDGAPVTVLNGDDLPWLPMFTALWSH